MSVSNKLLSEFCSIVAVSIYSIHLTFIGCNLHSNGILCGSVVSIATISQFVAMYGLILREYWEINPYRPFALIKQIMQHQDDAIYSYDRFERNGYKYCIDGILTAGYFCIVAILSPVLSILLLYSKKLKLLQYAMIHQLFFIVVNIISCMIAIDEFSIFGYQYTIISISGILYITITTFRWNEYLQNMKSLNMCFIVHILISFWILLIIVADKLFVYNRLEWYLIMIGVFNFIFPGIPCYDILLIKNYVDDYYKFVIMESKTNKEIMNKYYGAMGRLTEITYQKLNHSNNYNWIQQYKFIKLSLDGKILYLKDLDELYVESMELTDYEYIYIVSSIINYMFPILWILYFWKFIISLEYCYVMLFETMMILYVIYLLILCYFVILSEKILSNKMSYIRIRNIHESLRFCNNATNLKLTVESLKKDWYNMQIIEVIMDFFPQDVGITVVSFLLTDLAPW